MKSKLQFFIGKGGVGKSTTSALTAAHLSENGNSVLLVSMDPAHNQRDIFTQDFSEKPRKIHDRLSVKEVDVDYWIKKYIKETEKTIQKTYSYESAFNLQKYFHVLRFSPGLEEYALLLAFENIIHHHENRDIIIFDMAPTALALRFFSLPFIALIWLGELLKLRDKIYAKREIITKIKVAGKGIEQDKVKVKLTKLIHNNEHLRDRFLSPEVKINLVMNDDSLSVSEAVRIKAKLSEIGIYIDNVIINKAQQTTISEAVNIQFRHQKKALFPFSSIHLLGYEALRDYVTRNREISFQEEK
jgi:arsenite-transporting ATPase